MSLGSIGISWNPANRSMLLKYLAFCSWSRRSSIRGKGYASFSVTVLSFLKSTTSLHPPFFGTISIGLAQGLVEGRMTPLSKSSCMCSFSNVFKWWGILYGFCRMGVAFPVFILWWYDGLYGRLP